MNNYTLYNLKYQTKPSPLNFKGVSLQDNIHDQINCKLQILKCAILFEQKAWHFLYLLLYGLYML